MLPFKYVWRIEEEAVFSLREKRQPLEGDELIG